MSRERVIAIVGSGFSGTMVAVQLATKATEPLEIVLIERSGVCGRGVAYGTKDDSHLLNVQASNMSAFPDCPDHFVQWARPYGLIETDFAPRRLYGDYLTEVLRRARDSSNRLVKMREVADEVVGLEPEGTGFDLPLKSGGRIRADEVVLALGNFPAGFVGNLPFLAGKGVRVIGAWEQGVLESFSAEDRVLILGSGLTMIDTVLSLKKRGLRAPIQVISRHGHLPQPFEPTAPCPSLLEPGRRNPLSTVLRKYHARVTGDEKSRVTWRSLIGSLRSVTPDFWRGLNHQERARFLRHLKSLWDTHRHQMAPQAARKIKIWLDEGSLLVTAGRLRELEAQGKSIRATFRDRATGEVRSFSVDHVINGMGIEGNFATMKHPLVESLRRQRLIRPDPLGLGFEVTREGTVIDGNGVPSARLFAIGSARRAECWESVAVPELRVQAEGLANRLTGLPPGECLDVGVKLPPPIPAIHD